MSCQASGVNVDYFTADMTQCGLLSNHL